MPPNSLRFSVLTAYTTVPPLGHRIALRNFDSRVAAGLLRLRRTSRVSWISRDSEAVCGAGTLDSHLDNYVPPNLPQDKNALSLVWAEETPSRKGEACGSMERQLP